VDKGFPCCLTAVWSVVIASLECVGSVPRGIQQNVPGHVIHAKQKGKIKLSNY